MDSEAPSPDSPPQTNNGYTVIVRGETFELYHDQITFDSPNYFTACFLSGFAEARERTLRLSRNPTLFAIIVEYLSGYPILPLAPQAVPSNMDVATAHRCLLSDAQFYGLQKLCDMLKNPRPEIDMRWTGYANEMVSLQNVVKGTLPDGVVRRDDGTIVSRDSGLPVLAFAKDVVFTLLVNAAVKTNAPVKSVLRDQLGRPPHSYRALSLRLTSPAAPSTDIYLSLNPSRPPNDFYENLIREQYWEKTDGGRVQDSSRVYIGRKLRDFRDIQEAFFDGDFFQMHPWMHDEGMRMRSLGAFSEDGYTGQWRELSGVLWADEVLCRLVPPGGYRRGPSAPEDALVAELVRARLRTREDVLRNVRVDEVAQSTEGDD